MTQPASETASVVDVPAPVVEVPAPVVEQTPPVVEAAPAAADSTPEAEPVAEEPAKWEPEEDWKYDFLEFKGDRLAVRIPSGAALNALNMAQSKKVSDERRATLTRDLLTNHLSEASFDRVFFERSADPDEPDYNVNTLAELLSELLVKAGERVKAELEALKEVTQ
jgi:hypothetical protein